MSAIQILIHLWGDYILQSDWMAQNKTKHWWPALCHATVYSSLFLLLRPSLAAFAVILGTHFLIDRYRLARYVVWAKNWMGASRDWWRAWDGCEKSDWAVTDNGICPLIPGAGNFHYHAPTPPFAECCATGYPPTNPAWLSVWLMIIADNILHLTINGAALRWL